MTKIPPYSIMVRKGVDIVPRRKKLPTVPDYIGAGKEPENLLVQKSNPLLSLSETGLTLAEFKLLDAYLGRINSHDSEKRFIRFEKGEIENLLGVVKLNATDLEKRVRNLFQTVRIRDSSKREGFTFIALFEKAECYHDKDGLWQVDLGASPSAMEYIFNPERLGYLRYSLRNVVKLTSRYSYVLFLYLEQNRHMHLSWEVPLDELKALLRCTAESYNAYKEFNKKILKRCHEELSEKTDCRFTYEPLKRGRTIKAIQFTLEPLTEKDILPGQISLLEDYPEISTPSSPDDQIEFLRGACTPSDTTEPEFTRAEMEQLFTVLVTVPRDKLPRNVPVDSIEFRRYHYLAERYAAMNRLHEREPIQHRFSYLLKIVKKDAGTA